MIWLILDLLKEISRIISDSIDVKK